MVGERNKEPQRTPPRGQAPVILLEEQSLADALGIEIHYAPDEMAPPVDDDRLSAFVRYELAEEETEEVLQLIATFRCWHDGWAEAVRREPHHVDPEGGSD